MKKGRKEGGGGNFDGVLYSVISYLSCILSFYHAGDKKKFIIAFFLTDSLYKSE